MILMTDILAYAIALGVAAGIPGPGITALVARSISGGTIAGYAMLVGLILGDFVFLSFAVFGLSVVANQYSSVFDLIRWFSVAYLLYLSWQFWFAERHDVTVKDNTQKTLFMAALSGFTITLSNPKAIAFYLALVPLVLDLDTISTSVLVSVLLPVTMGVLLIVGSVYILGAISVRKSLSSASAQRRLHRTAAVAMGGAAFSIIAREI